MTSFCSFGLLDMYFALFPVTIPSANSAFPASNVEFVMDSMRSIMHCAHGGQKLNAVAETVVVFGNIHCLPRCEKQKSSGCFVFFIPNITAGQFT